MVSPWFSGQGKQEGLEVCKITEERRERRGSAKRARARARGRDKRGKDWAIISIFHSFMHNTHIGIDFG